MIRAKHATNDTRTAENYIKGKEYIKETRELKDVEVTVVGLLGFVLKQLCVMTKIVLSVRANQVRVMEHNNISLIEPERDDQPAKIDSTDEKTQK